MSAVVLPAAISHFTSTQVIFSNSTRLVWAHGGFSFTSSVCAPATVAVIPSTAKPATATITLHTDLFMLPPLPLLTGCNGEPTIPQVHYSHNDVAVSARFCYWLGGVFRSTLGGSRARRFTRARRVCPGRVHCPCSRSSIPDTIRYNPATAKAGGRIGRRVARPLSKAAAPELAGLQ